MNTPFNVNRLSFFAPSVLARLLTLVGIAGLALGAVVGAIFFQERNHETLLLCQQGLQRVDEEDEFLIGEVGSVRSDVLYLAEQQLLMRFLHHPDETREQIEQEYVRFARRRTIYDQIRFLDMSGKEVIRINHRNGEANVVPQNQLQEKTDRYYFQAATKLRPGEVFISDFDLNVEHGEIERPIEPVLRFLTPVVDERGVIRGLLTLNYSGDHLLRRVNEFSLPGLMLLVNSEGFYIQGPDPQDDWGWLLSHSRTFPRQYPLAWRAISDRFRGLAVTEEGVFAFRRVFYKQPLPTGSHEQPLLLISFVPAARQHADSRKLLQQLLWMYGGAMLLLVAFGWVWARSAAIRKQQAESIQASEARLRTLSDQLLSAQEEERRSISRELHDQLSQQVTAISLDLQSAARQSDAAKASTLLNRSIAEVDQLLHSIHQFATRVRPAVLDDLGLREALQSLAAEVGQRSNVAISTEIEIDDRLIPPKIVENVYRIVQEALLNIVKHAHTDQAKIAISNSNDRLLVCIEDTGVGFDPNQRDHSRLGLLGMQERAELLGGRFQITSQPHSGTRLEVSIPLAQVR